jgi:hypothetical protein
VRFVLFCEAPADFRTASALVDRVLHEHAPSWVGDLLSSFPESVRAWAQDGHGREFFDIHNLDTYRRNIDGLRFQQGHFDGKPGAADAQSARNAFTIIRALNKRRPTEEIGVVFFVRDMDDQGDSRRKGLEQARSEASRQPSFAIVLGCADRMREAWVLAGFEPESDEEAARLEETRRELGFCPCEDAHLLDAVRENAKGSPKRVVRHLIAKNGVREERCWTEAPLERLKARGEASGLRAFLAEIRERVVPLCGEERTRKSAYDHLVEEQ